METATITDLRAGVAEYMGVTTMPLGNQEAYDRSIQAAVDYCWRYAKWNFAIRRNVLLSVGSGEHINDYYLPADFDVLSWRDLGGSEYSITDDYVKSMPNALYLEYDDGLGRFRVNGGTGVQLISYQVKPPQAINTVVSFPSIDVICQIAAIYQKRKENPNSSDITQAWDLAHQTLDQLVSNAYFNTPNRKPKNRYELYGTYVGDTR